MMLLIIKSIVRIIRIIRIIRMILIIILVIVTLVMIVIMRILPLSNIGILLQVCDAVGQLLLVLCAVGVLPNVVGVN